MASDSKQYLMRLFQCIWGLVEPTVDKSNKLTRSIASDSKQHLQRLIQCIWGLVEPAVDTLIS